MTGSNAFVSWYRKGNGQLCMKNDIAKCSMLNIYHGGFQVALSSDSFL
jgi:hypothetical protein